MDSIKMIIEFLYNWQTLIGAIIGGAVGAMGALIVAHSEKIRHEYISANLLAVEIGFFLSRISDARKAVEEILILKRIYATHIPLSSLFETSMATIMSVDKDLTIHLGLFEKFYRVGYLKTIDELSKYIERAERNNQQINLQEMPPYIDNLMPALDLAEKHAKPSLYLMEKLFPNNGCVYIKRLIFSIQRRYCPSPQDVESKKILLKEK